MANKPSGKSATSYFANYKASNTHAKNRKRKLEKQLKLQPNNEQVKTALGNIMYRRSTPTKREWSASWIRVAKIFKMFEGRFDRNIMSNNPTVAAAALQGHKDNSQYPKPKPHRIDRFFSLAARVGAI